MLDTSSTLRLTECGPENRSVPSLSLRDVESTRLSLIDPLLSAPP